MIADPAPVPHDWRDRRLLLLLALGFAAAVPLPLAAGQVLRQWFSESGLSLGAIGATALIGLAYANKFLWAPLLDQAKPPLPLGQRRGWLLTLQLALAASIAAIGATDPVAGAVTTVALAVLVAFLSASHDIVLDAYRIELCGPDAGAQARGLAAYVWGYRLALLAAGAGTLLLVAPLGWGGAYLAAASLMAVGVVATLAAPREVPLPPSALGWVARLRTGIVEPFRQFTQRRYWLAILAFVALFKSGEALAGLMTTPFYRELGFSREQVATVGSAFGLAATLAGAVAGAWLVPRLGVGRALVLTGLGQMFSNLMYVALYRDPSLPMLWAQVGIEGFTDGLADAAFLTYLSGLTHRAFTATQYALLSSLAAVPLRTLGATSGWIAAALGWPAFFTLTSAAALPAMAIMLFLLRRLPP